MNKNIQDLIKNKVEALINESKISKSEPKNITPEDVEKLVSEMKKINSKVNMLNPLMVDGEVSLVEKVLSSNKRKLTTPMGKEYDIELKEDLNETMKGYNNEKQIFHKESEVESWARLIGHKKFSDK